MATLTTGSPATPPRRRRVLTSPGAASAGGRDLTEREKRFVREYLVDYNARRAAAAVGYSAKCAKQIGSRVLHRPSVVAELAARGDKLARGLEVTAERTLAELAQIAYAPRGYVQDRDKTAAIALLGKALRLFVDRHEVDVGDATFTLSVGARAPRTGRRGRD